MLDIGGVKVLIKSTLCQTLKKPARQGSQLAVKEAYIDVSDRRLHVQLTQEAKIASDFSLIRAIFAFAGFVSGLTPPMLGIGGNFARSDTDESTTFNVLSGPYGAVSMHNHRPFWPPGSDPGQSSVIQRP